MKVTSIIENTSSKGLSVEHGLSLYIEKVDGQKMYCTGEDQYRKLRSLMNAQIEYLACGDALII